uniref:PAS fold-3 domain-containing protein n=1 Tax=Timema shepardi TaxID=629360 RepID=A0A7R9FZM1_TIMSH|nr:unnamed protein product [Timema shepardi]
MASLVLTYSSQLPSDSQHLVFSKGQCETDSYRFLAKNGGYVWVLTQATLLYGNRGQKPNSVVCVNFVTSRSDVSDTFIHQAL